MNNLKAGSVFNFHYDIIALLCLIIVGIACGGGGGASDEGDKLIEDPALGSVENISTAPNESENVSSVPSMGEVEEGEYILVKSTYDLSKLQSTGRQQAKLVEVKYYLDGEEVATGANGEEVQIETDGATVGENTVSSKLFVGQVEAASETLGTVKITPYAASVAKKIVLTTAKMKPNSFYPGTKSTLTSKFTVDNASVVNDKKWATFIESIVVIKNSNGKQVKKIKKLIAVKTKSGATQTVKSKLIWSAADTKKVAAGLYKFEHNGKLLKKHKTTNKKKNIAKSNKVKGNIEVLSSDQPPEEKDPIEPFTVLEDATNTILDLSNLFTDPDNDDSAIVVTVKSNSNQNLVTHNLNNKTLTLAYTPEGSGQSTITLLAQSNNKEAESSFTVTIQPVDDPPVVVNPIPDVSVFEGASNIDIDLSSVFNDVDNDNNTMSFIVDENTASTYVNATIQQHILSLQFISGQAGNYGFIRIKGISGFLSATTQFNVDVLVNNDPPIAVADGPFSIQQNELLSVPVANSVLNNDRDPEGDALKALHVSGPAHGVLTLAENGSFTYRSNSTYTGTDVFTYYAKDERKVSNAVTVSINVTSPPNPNLDFSQEDNQEFNTKSPQFDGDLNFGGDVDLDSVKVYIDGVLQSGVVANPYEFQWKGNNISEGDHTMRVTASRSSDNTIIENSLDFSVNVPGAEHRFENIEVGNLPAGWSSSGLDTAIVVNSFNDDAGNAGHTLLLSASGSDYGSIVVPSTDTSDNFTLKADIFIFSGTGYIHLRGENLNNGYRVEINQSKIKLLKVVNSAVSVLAEAKANELNHTMPSAGNWYNLNIRVDGSRIDVFELKSKAHLTANDTSFNSDTSQYLIGLVSGTLIFDNIEEKEVEELREANLSILPSVTHTFDTSELEVRHDVSLPKSYKNIRSGLSIDNVISQSGAQTSALIYSSDSVKSITELLDLRQDKLELRADVFTSGGRSSFQLRANGVDNGYIFSVRPDRLSILKLVNGVETELAHSVISPARSAQFPEANKWFEITIKLNGNNLVFQESVSGTNLQVNDATFVGSINDKSYIVTNDVLFAAFDNINIQQTITNNQIAWIGEGDDDHWTTEENWEGGVVPDANSIALFSGEDANQKIEINQNIEVAGIYIAHTFAGEINQSDNALIKIGLAGYSQDNGTFNASAGGFELEGDWKTTGGTFDGRSASLTYTSKYIQSIETLGSENNLDFSSLTISETSGGGLINQNNPLVVGNLNINSSSLQSLNQNVIVNGDLTQSAGKLVVRGAILKITGLNSQIISQSPQSHLNHIILANSREPLTLSGDQKYAALDIEAGVTVIVEKERTIQSNALMINGTEANPVYLSSSQQGSHWNLNISEVNNQNTTIMHVSVEDSNATGQALVIEEGGIDRGNNLNWYFDPNFVDTDNDGLDDNWERAQVGNLSRMNGGTDTDGDGISDIVEMENGTSPILSDSDGDGIGDSLEISLGLNPIVADAEGDADKDLLNNITEIDLGTNPTNKDSDGDKMIDGWEVKFNLDPLDPSDAHLDKDGDGFDNLREHRLGMNPRRGFRMDRNNELQLRVTSPLR